MDDVKIEQETSKLEDWNWMENDYNSPEWNRYCEGPGSKMPSELSPANYIRGKKLFYKLFISPLPACFTTKDSLFNVFSECGEVEDVKICSKQSENGFYRFGFVTYSKQEHADTAIRTYDKHYILKFRVAYARDESIAPKNVKTTELDYPLPVLPPSIYEGTPPAEINAKFCNNMERITELEDMIKKTCKVTIKENEETDEKVTESDSTMKSGNGLLPFEKIRCSLNGNVFYLCKDKTEGYRSEDLMKAVFEIGEEILFDTDNSRLVFKPCLNCQKMTRNLCSKCEQSSFCSIPCQEKMWPQHKKSCYLPVKNNAAGARFINRLYEEEVS